MQKKLATVFQTAIMIMMICLSVEAANEQVKEEKIAVVNGTFVTKDDYERELERITEQAASQGKQITEAELPTIKKQIIDNIAEMLILYQDALEKGIKEDQAQIDTAVAKLKSGFPDEEAFKKTLAEKKITEELIRDQLKKRSIIQKFIEQTFAQKTVVPDSDVKAFYDNNPDKFNKPESVKASHILILVDTKADETQKKAAREKIEKILARVKAGEDFAALAKENSQDPGSSEKGGELGFFTRGQMVKPFEDAAFALAQGAVSDIVVSDFGYHIIKVTEKQAAGKLSLEEVKPRLADYLKSNKVNQEVSEYIKALKAKAKIEIF